ncbi:MAG: histidine kinase [Halieaceae bacterium]|jgi:sensor histidine kinase YesM|nr:histidine kinase [Halieaceae bacterium]MBT6264610.1 histidine kinase [Halieaceae bacterium]
MNQDNSSVTQLNRDENRDATLAQNMSSGRLFWIMNSSGWVALSVLTYFSLSLPYSQFELSYFAHNISQSVVGLLLTLPLRWCFKSLWSWPVAQRFILAVIATIFFSMLWAVLRLLLFMLMTQEQNLWADYGGWVFPSIFVFFTWSALYHGIKYYQLLQQQREAMLVLESQQRQRALQLVRAKAEVKDAQLQLLRYQLNPHFLFNTLNSVASLVSAERTEDAKTMLSRLGDFLRYSLDAGEDMLIPLDKEFWALSQYLMIEQVRFSDRMTLKLDVPANLESLLVPNMLLQPLAENAIKYAIAPSESGGTIRVSAQLKDSRLVLSVEDSGSERLGVSSDTLELSESGAGIGLRNTRERLKNLFSNDFELLVTDSPLGGLCFSVAIPATESIREESM